MNKNSFKNKPGLVINEHAGAVSLINEHGKESVNISHISGASFGMNPVQTSIFSPENRTDTSLNDEFKTVLGDMTEFVGKSKSVSIGGDHNLTFGNAKAWLDNTVQEYYNKFTESMAPFVRPDINRPMTYPVAGLPVNEYPTERGQLVSVRLNPALEQLKNNFCESLISTVANPLVLNDFIIDFAGLLEGIKTAIDALTNGVSGLIGDIIAAVREAAIKEFLDKLKEILDELKQKLLEIICEFISIPAQLIQFINAYVGGISAAIQSTLSLFLKQEPHSTEGNTYTSNDKSGLDDYLIQQQQEFLEIERSMGTGGNGANNVLKNKIDNIGGGAFNKNIPLAWDPTGREIIVGPYIDTNMGMVPLPGGVHLLQRSVVNDVCDIGNYMLNVGNKFTVNSGGGGIALNSLGAIDITTPLTTIKSHIVELQGDLIAVTGGVSSQIESPSDGRITPSGGILFESKGLFTLKAPIDIVVDSNCYITNNLTTQGGAYFNGEVYLNHITSPLEMQKTMENSGYASAQFNLNIPFTLEAIEAPTLGGKGTYKFICLPPAEDEVRIDPITVRPHVHDFPNTPHTLIKGTPIGLTPPTDIGDPLELPVTTAHAGLRKEAQVVLNTEPARAFRIKDGDSWTKTIT